MTKTSADESVQPKIVRGQVDSLSIFEITDYELELLEQGSPNSLFLNFAIFFISAAISFLTALITIPITSIQLFSVFVVFTVVGFSSGIVLLILWGRTKSKIKLVLKKIKARVPLKSVSNDPVQQQPVQGPTEASRN